MGQICVNHADFDSKCVFCTMSVRIPRKSCTLTPDAAHYISTYLELSPEDLFALRLQLILRNIVDSPSETNIREFCTIALRFSLLFSKVRTALVQLSKSHGNIELSAYVSECVATMATNAKKIDP